ncbi:MAG TPA: Gfo/Idh/MocA family oxidoreductase [Planctomycetaceae bacterium]|nr:Gfo/Idh/MocA family oxidoreductase [Planctomycetaceae bacterium]
MQLTPEQKQMGKDNFNEAVGFSRREFLVGAAAAGSGLGAYYFGYEKLRGEPVRVGFIGTGDEGSVLLTQHPPEYMDIIAVADIRPSNRVRALHGDGNDDRVGLIKKLGEKKALSIKLYEDHRALLADPRVEAVVIAVPLIHHSTLAFEALKAGKHVLSEKLMARTTRECKDMIKAAKDANLLLAVGHQRHYSVLYDNAYNIIKMGLLGDIRHIRAQWHRNNSFPNRDSWIDKIPKEDNDALKDKIAEYGYMSVEELVNWRLYNRTGGGLMAELGSHQLDASSIFLGKVKPIAVSGYGGKNFYGVKGIGSKDKQEDKREIDDHVYVTFEFPGSHYDAQDNPNDIAIVTYSSLNTNRLEPYGETVFGSRATLMVQTEQQALLYKEASPETGGGGVEQRLYVINGNDSGPVLSASASLAPSAGAAAAGATVEKISRGYTEEMEHFCHCVRNKIYAGPKEGGLRCNGTVAMADAIMALTSNLAMKHKKRIVFKPEWFDPDNDAVPEADKDVIG